MYDKGLPAIEEMDSRKGLVVWRGVCYNGECVRYDRGLRVTCN